MANLPTKKAAFNSLISIASLGLLIGVLVGLSSSPVVGSLIGTLATIFVTMFSSLFPAASNDDGKNEKSQRRLPHFAFDGQPLTVFCLVCLVGIFSGIWIRTHNLLSPSIADQIEEWTDAKFDPNLARLMVARQLTEQKDGANIRSSVLFDSLADNFQLLKPTEFGDAENISEAWKNMGGDFEKSVAVKMDTLSMSDQDKRKVYMAIWEALQQISEAKE